MVLSRPVSAGLVVIPVTGLLVGVTAMNFRVTAMLVCVTAGAGRNAAVGRFGGAPPSLRAGGVIFGSRGRRLPDDGTRRCGGGGGGGLESPVALEGFYAAVLLDALGKSATGSDHDRVEKVDTFPRHGAANLVHAEPELVGCEADRAGRREPAWNIRRLLLLFSLDRT